MEDEGRCVETINNDYLEAWENDLVARETVLEQRSMELSKRLQANQAYVTKKVCSFEKTSSQFEAIRAELADKFEGTRTSLVRRERRLQEFDELLRPRMGELEEQVRVLKEEVAGRLVLLQQARDHLHFVQDWLQVRQAWQGDVQAGARRHLQAWRARLDTQEQELGRMAQEIEAYSKKVRDKQKEEEAEKKDKAKELDEF